MSNQEVTESDDRPESVEQQTLKTADAHLARNADASDMAVVEEARTNPSDGSLRDRTTNGQDESIQIVGCGVVSSRQSKLTENDLASVKSPKASISLEELKEKAATGDGMARDLVSYFSKAMEMPPGPDRDHEIGLQQRNADRCYRRGEFAGRAAHPQADSPPKSETVELLKKEAASNPALEPVAALRAYADSQPDGPERERLLQLAKEQASELSPELRKRYQDEATGEETLLNSAPEPIAEKHGDGWLLKVGISETVAATDPESMDWVEASQRIARLPLETQFEILGTGLKAGLEKYSQEERERALGRLIGTVQGIGEVSVNLAKIADFTASILIGDQERAAKQGEEFGTALGQTIVGGIKLFQAADQYLFNIGYTGDYSKPFTDVVALADVLNQRWNELPPREQERVKAKLVTEIGADMILGAVGTKAIGRAKNFTDVLDEIAGQCADAGQKLAANSKRAVRAISNAVDDLMPPVADTGMGLKMPIPRETGKNLDDFALKMEKCRSEGTPDKAFRGDHDVYSPLNTKGRRKAHVNENGDLVPANPEGIHNGKKVTIAQHLAPKWSKGAKANSPYISFSTTDGVTTKFGPQRISLDVKALRSSIEEGETVGVKIYEHHEVLKCIEDSDYSGSVKEVLKRFVKADREIIVEGIIPKRFIQVASK